MNIESLFGLNDNAATTITTLNIDQLIPYENQPFKLYPEAKLQELADDIQNNGLINPIVVRKLGRQFQILAGHNRVNALKRIGQTEVPAIVKELTDEQADLLLVQSNLLQRQELLNSEKARAYKMRHDALKQLNHYQKGKNTLQELAESETISERTIARYIKAASLIDDLMRRFDYKEFSLPSAEQLAGLAAGQQSEVDNYLEVSSNKLKPQQAAQIVDYAREHPDFRFEDLQVLLNNQEEKQDNISLTTEMLLEYAKLKYNDIDDNTFNICIQVLKEKGLLSKHAIVD